MAQLDQLQEVKFGKDPNNKKRPREFKELNLTKKSIMWELPYWKKLNLRHNLDVMHIEKNICENFYGMMLAIDGKNKDTYKAREDLQEMGISYPNCYAANILRCVTSKNGRLSGMKSHDCHVLLLRLLPISMHGFMNKEIYTTLFELGKFFQELCSKTLRQTDLEKMEERIALVLCKFEKNFPLAFFDVIVHLAVHLPREAMFAGPVQYRRMYPDRNDFEWYVSNRACPEGSIVEADIVKECLTFCSMYLKGIDKPERNDDGGERGSGMEVFTQNARIFSPITRALDLSQNEREMAHWFVLYNSSEVKPYIEHMNDLRRKGSPEVTNKLWSLANGPGSIIDFYSGCIYNGIRFHTRNCENHRTCQNSGLVVEGDHNGNQINFYGYLSKMWELKYLHGGTVVLFQCEWYDTSHKNRIYSGGHVTSIDVARLWYKDDQFVLPSMVRQVFYVNDTNKGKNWRVVEWVKHWGVWDIPKWDDVSNDVF
ncbi:uncharacterized protein LOC114319186 [Camellia sinensis]|uniref:uncharacterized protein LOC114319186 n=1 Tax=Camellia sinensis TaxID=4442 RepID=UPI001036C645|nr:uncharacterized protein LOC114319186 [Camellia sinensis]